MFKKKESIEARITNAKHPKTRHKPLQKKENAGFSLNSLTISYDNSIVDGLVIGSVQQEFHCSCCARNETLAVSGCLIYYLLSQNYLENFLFLRKAMK